MLKLHRKEFARLIGTSAALKPYAELEETETRRFLFRLLEEPEKLTKHIRT